MQVFPNDATAKVVDGAVVSTGTLRALLHPTSTSRTGIDSDYLRAEFGIYPVQTLAAADGEQSTAVEPYYSEADDAVYSNTVAPLDIETLRLRRKRELREIFRVHRSGTTYITVGGETVPVSLVHDAVVEIEGAARKLSRNGAPATIKVKTRGGVRFPMTLAVATAALEAIDDKVAEHVEREHDYDALLDAAQTVEELNAIDLTAGWTD
jgi:hypothetical protein